MPLTGLGCAWLAGMVVASCTCGHALAPLLWGVAATATVGMAWWVGVARRGRWGAKLAVAGLLGAAFSAGGWYYLGWRLCLTAAMTPYTGRPCEWWGTVTREPLLRDGRLEAVIRVSRVNPPGEGKGGMPYRREVFRGGGGDRVRATVLIRVAGWETALPGDGAAGANVRPAGEEGVRSVPVVGDLVRVCGTATLPSPPRNPGEFDYAGWLRAQGIAGVVRAHGPGALEVRGTGALGPADRVAAWLRVRFLAGVRAYLGRVEGAVVEGMVLGIRTGLPDEVEDTFRRSGLVHLLAVSGSNVALVAGLMRWLLRWAGVRPSLTGSLIGTWVFAATASGGPSVGRAAVMATVMLLGRLLGRPHHPLNSLAVAVVLLTAANPCAWEDPGFWLSVAATAGILGMASGRAGTPPASGCSGRVVRLLLGLMRAGREVLAVTCAAQAAVLPVSLYYFQQASLVAPLSNLMVFPFTGAVTVGGMACATLAAVHPGLGVAFSPLRMLVRAVLGLARFFGDLPGAAVTLPAPRWPHLLAYYVAFAWVAGWLRWSLLPRHGPWTRPRLVVAALLVVVILAVSLATAPPRHILQVVFFSVGQGDAILLWRPGGPAMLVDCGPLGPGYDAGADTVIPYLRRHGIRRLDLLVLTHGHADHTGGAAAVLGNLPVAHLWLGPGASLPSLAGADASTATAPAGASGSVAPEAWRDVPGCVLRPVAGERAVLAPGWEVIVLHPPHPVGGAASASAGQGRGPAAWGISGGAGLTPAASGSGEREGGDDGQNDSSLVLLVRYGRVNILLAGDLETVGEALFLREGARLCPRGVDLLKVPHHGSATSCSAAFLDRVRPRFAVVQVGPNPFGHPAAATVRRLKEAGARVWRTDLHGAVVARTDGRRLSVTAVLGHGAVAGVWGSSAEARR